MKNSKLLKAKDLFQVKLGETMEGKGWKAADLARAMPGVPPAIISRWLKKGSNGRIPTGIYMCWLLMVLGITPEELVGPVPVSESLNSRREGTKQTRSVVRADSDARWLLGALEGLVSDFRRRLDDGEKGGKAEAGTSG